MKRTLYHLDRKHTYEYSLNEPLVKKPLGRAIQKGGRRKGSKIDQNLPTNSFRKPLTWKMSTSFMAGPLWK